MISNTPCQSIARSSSRFTTSSSRPQHRSPAVMACSRTFRWSASMMQSGRSKTTTVLHRSLTIHSISSNKSNTRCAVAGRYNIGLSSSKRHSMSCFSPTAFLAEKSDLPLISPSSRTACVSSSLSRVDVTNDGSVCCVHKDVEMIAANHRKYWQLLSSSRRSMSTTTSTTAAPPNAEAKTSGGSMMKDEYGAMDSEGETYRYPGDFVLENGQVLPDAQLRYKTYGALNEARDNVLVICHALTGNASLHSWWGGLLGDGTTGLAAFDTSKYLIVCCNILGSCYGSTAPTSINPDTNRPYGLDFPDVSVQDTVRLQLLLLQRELNIRSVKAVIGGSFGGMQALEFAVQGGVDANTLSDDERNAFNDWRAFGTFRDTDDCCSPFVRTVIPIACGARHTAWQIAISEVQRQAVYKDPAWKEGNPFGATAGLEVARQMGMVSYRTPRGYQQKFGRNVMMRAKEDDGQEGQETSSSLVPAYGSSAPWQVKSYLEYQGHKFLSRFDPVTYVKLTEQMDSHDIARGRGEDIAHVLEAIKIPALVLGIDSDVLYPLAEQEELARHLPNGHVKVVRSDDGHDGFLLEQEQVAAYIIEFLQQHD